MHAAITALAGDTNIVEDASDLAGDPLVDKLEITFKVDGTTPSARALQFSRACNWDLAVATSKQLVTIKVLKSGSACSRTRALPPFVERSCPSSSWLPSLPPSPRSNSFYGRPLGLSWWISQFWFLSRSSTSCNCAWSGTTQNGLSSPWSRDIMSHSSLPSPRGVRVLSTACNAFFPVCLGSGNLSLASWNGRGVCLYNPRDRVNVGEVVPYCVSKKFMASKGKSLLLLLSGFRIGEFWYPWVLMRRALIIPVLEVWLLLCVRHW